MNKIGGAHVQCMNNPIAKFEYKVGVIDYTNQIRPKHFGWKKYLKFITRKKIFIKCAQNRRSTSSMCEQSLCKV